MLVAAAALWFYWLAFLLVIGAGGAIVMTAVGYYVKVLRNKVPRRER